MFYIQSYFYYGYYADLYLFPIILFVWKKELVKIPIFGTIYKRICVMVDRKVQEAVPMFTEDVLKKWKKEQHCYFS
jgi:uncharacterized membrane protein